MTPRFTLGKSGSPIGELGWLLVGDQATDTLNVAGIDQQFVGELAGHLLGLLAAKVAAMAFHSDHLACSGYSEAGRGPFVGFKLRHPQAPFRVQVRVQV